MAAKKSNISLAEGNNGAGNRSITSYDVALRAEVSQSAVSRCFKPGASVSDALRAKVMQAALDLNYTPNAIARSLITRRTNLVAVLISNLTNLYYPEVLSELSHQFVKNGMRVLLFTLPHEGDVDEVIAQVWGYQVDGVVAAARLTAAQVNEFERRKIPFVLYNRSLRDRPVNAVVCDQIAGARTLVSRMVVPYVKAAVIDRRLFQSKAHPARLWDRDR